MSRPTVSELSKLCQKPDHRRVGNWLARRVTRDVALRITWLILPWPISATQVTLSGWAMAVSAAGALALGSAAGWMIAAVLLQLWYLADHVDGQLARYRRAASLDGTQLDYLMHHTVNLLLPIGAGNGLTVRTGHSMWSLAGIACGVAMLVIQLQHDARYKSFFQRLKRLEGTLLVRGGGGARPAPPAPPPVGALRRVFWLARKACETHVVINAIAAVAVLQVVTGDAGQLTARVYLLALTALAVLVSATTAIRAHRAGNAEREFAAWFDAPPDAQLVFRDGWWRVDTAQNRRSRQHAQDTAPQPRST